MLELLTLPLPVDVPGIDWKEVISDRDIGIACTYRGSVAKVEITVDRFGVLPGHGPQ